MRYLILSDIHANWHALKAVLEHAGSCDRIICCGDLVGYGADPNPVVDWARAKVSVIVRGNHDKACSGLDDLEWFNPVARAAALWTQHELTAENLAYLRELPKGPAPLDSFQVLHGSPLDEDEYLISLFDARQASQYLERPLSFFGHTHLQGGFLCKRNAVRRIEKIPVHLEERIVDLEPETAYLINPGSVGQPRDRDPRAAYLIHTPEERLLEFRRISYDVAGAQQRIREAGLPELLAERLATGT